SSSPPASRSSATRSSPIRTRRSEPVPDATRSRGSFSLPPQTHDTIGERLNDAGLDWAWYSGGWNQALRVNADPDNNKADTTIDGDGVAEGAFQFHHQPFLYFAKYADGQPAQTVALLACKSSHS